MKVHIPHQPARRRWRMISIAVVAMGAVTAIVPSVSNAADSGSVTLTITAAPVVRSVVVGSSSPAGYRGCFTAAGGSTGSTLRFPNGYCNTDAGQVSVTMGEVASVLQVETSLMSAVGATSWAACDCTPGTDQFRLNVMPYYGTMTPLVITGTPVCDYATFAIITGVSSAGCITIPANSVSSPNLRLTGPTSVTSNPSGAWSHTITWRAMPVAAPA